MPNYDVDELAALPVETLEERLATATARAETRAARAKNESRDFTKRESELMTADAVEMRALQQAIDRIEGDAERRATMGADVDRAVAMHRAGVEHRAAFRPTLLVSEANLAAHADALRDGRPFGAVEARARLTAAGDLGSAGGWAAGTPNEPRHLISFAGIPVSELTGRTAQVPQYTGPTAAAGVAETVAHAEYDAINPVDLVALRYGRWSDVSALANAVDDLTGVNQMHAWGIARDLDLLAVTSVQAAAGAPIALGVDLDQQVREAILTVAASTYSDESQLVIVGTPADLSLLTSTTPTNGNDVGSTTVRYAGARLYPTLAATADRVTVFAPNAFRVFMSRLQSASQINPSDGSNKFGSWLHSTPVAAQIVGAAAAVETSE